MQVRRHSHSRILVVALALTLAIVPTHLATDAQAIARTTPSLYLDQFQMVSPNVGWATGTAGVLRTTDGGSTWRVVKSGGCADALVASGPQWAWFTRPCSGGPRASITVWRTNNGGRTWTSSAIDFGSRAPFYNYPVLDFSGDRTGWLELMASSIGPSSMNALYRTTDSGTHWTQVQPSPAVAYLLGFQSGTRGFASNFGYMGYVDFGQFLYETNSGGKTWARKTVKAPTGYANAIVTVSTAGFSGARSATIPVDLFRNTSNPPRSVHLFTTYRTTDGGESWSRGESLGGTADNEFGSYFFNATYGWADEYRNGGNVLMRTIDGGKHWTAIGRQYIGGFFRFVTPRVGFELGYDSSGKNHPGVLRTVDSGKTWKFITPRLVSS